MRLAQLNYTKGKRLTLKRLEKIVVRTETGMTMIETIDSRLKSLFGALVPNGEQQPITRPPELTTQVSTTPVTCADISKLVDLTELHAGSTDNYDLNIFISIGVLCILAIACIIALTFFLSTWQRCNRRNKVTPHEMEYRELPAEHNVVVKNKGDVPTVSGNVAIIDVLQLRQNNALTTQDECRDELGRPNNNPNSGQKISYSCPAFYTDMGSSRDELFD